MRRKLTLALVVIALVMMTLPLTVRGQQPPGPRMTIILPTTPTTAIGQPITYPLFRNQVIALLVEVAPGARVGRHQHAFPTVVVVLEGTLTVEIEGHGQRVVGARQALIEPLNVLHDAVNRGPTPVKALVVTAGEQGRPEIPAAEPAGAGVRSEVLLRTSTTAAGQPVVLPLLPTGIFVGTGEFPPGSANLWHTHPVNQLVYVLQGAFTLEIEGQPTQVISAGRAFMEPVSPAWNRTVNQGTVPLVTVVVFFEEEGKPRSINRTP